MIIVDRRIDVVSPLLHDIHYQSMLADLQGFFRRKVTAEDKEYVLDEADLFWTKVKGWHISKVVEFVMTEFEKFKNENKAAQWELKGGDHSGQSGIENLKDVLNSFGLLI